MIKVNLRLLKNKQVPSSRLEIDTETNTFSDFKQKCSEQLGIKAKRVFSSLGLEISMLPDIANNEIYYISEGEPFIHREPNSIVAKQQQQIKSLNDSVMNKTSTIKIALLGSSQSGKSALVSQFLFNKFNNDYQPTIEDVYTHSRRFQEIEETVEFEILDTAGLEEYRNIVNDQKVKESDAYIIAINLSSQLALETSDRERRVEYRKAEKFAQDRRSPYIECSALNNENITEVFELISREVKKYNYNNGKHYRLESDIGQQTRIEQDGSFVKIMKPEVTGTMSFQQRIELSKSLNRGLAPRIPSTNRSPSRQLYTPQQNKLEGYSQFPRPITQPYDNNIDQNLQVQTHQYKRLQKASIDQMKKLMDNRNQSMDQKSQNAIRSVVSNLSGTMTGFKLNVQNYRDKLLGSVAQNLEQNVKAQLDIENEDAYSGIKPKSQSVNRRLMKNIDQIDNLRKKLMSNQSGRTIHGRFLSSPPVHILTQNLNQTPQLRYNENRDKNAFEKSVISYSHTRPGTTLTGQRSQQNKSINLSFGTPQVEKVNFNNTDSALNKSMNPGTMINFNTTYNSNIQGAHYDRILNGYSTLKDRYQGTQIKSFFQLAKERQNLIPDDSFNQDAMNMSQFQNSQIQNGWMNSNQDSFNFTCMNQTKTGAQLQTLIKQQNFDQQISLPQKAKEYRAKTKGRFAGTFINDQATNFNRDKKWQLIANPVARAAEDKYLRRDKFLLEKRRYQRILKEMQCEETAGIKGVTKIPEQFISKKQ
eukprot:403348894